MTPNLLYTAYCTAHDSTPEEMGPPSQHFKPYLAWLQRQRVAFAALHRARSPHLFDRRFPHHALLTEDGTAAFAEWLTQKFPTAEGASV